MGRRFGFNIWLWGLPELVGDDINANFISLDDLLAKILEISPTLPLRFGQYWVVYGLKPERVPIATAEGQNNSINNMDMFLQQFTIMLKSMKNTDVWNMRNYRRIQSIMRMPFKYFTYWNPNHINNQIVNSDPMFWDSSMGKRPVEYFDKTDIPENQAMRFEILNENIRHDFRTGNKILEIPIRNYKPFRQISVGNDYGVNYE